VEGDEHVHRRVRRRVGQDLDRSVAGGHELGFEGGIGKLALSIGQAAFV
jgi:hypothetical protein